MKTIFFHISIAINFLFLHLTSRSCKRTKIVHNLHYPENNRLITLQPFRNALRVHLRSSGRFGFPGLIMYPAKDKHAEQRGSIESLKITSFNCLVYPKSGFGLLLAFFYSTIRENHDI